MSVLDLRLLIACSTSSYHHHCTDHPHPQVSIFALYKLLQVGSNADNLLELMEVCACMYACVCVCVCVCALEYVCTCACA